MVIYLRHPKHGTKVAVSAEEATADEKNGWERFQWSLKVTIPPEEAPKRRGRPPKAA